jgi:hypothetical protein
MRAPGGSRCSLGNRPSVLCDNRHIRLRRAPARVRHCAQLLRPTASGAHPDPRGADNGAAAPASIGFTCGSAEASRCCDSPDTLRRSGWRKERRCRRCEVRATRRSASTCCRQYRALGTASSRIRFRTDQTHWSRTCSCRPCWRGKTRCSPRGNSAHSVALTPPPGSRGWSAPTRCSGWRTGPARFRPPRRCRRTGRRSSCCR